MEDHPPPPAEGGASSAALVIPYHNNYFPPLSPLHYVVLQLPIEHITSFLSNTSVAFFALAIDPSYSSHDGSSGVAGTSDEAVNFLMEEEDVVDVGQIFASIVLTGSMIMMSIICCHW